MNELEIKKNFEIAIPQEKVEFIKKAKEMSIRADIFMQELKEAGEKFLEENNITSYSQDGISIIKVSNYKKRVIKTEALKDDGLYEEYSEEKEYPGYIKVDLNYEE